MCFSLRNWLLNIFNKSVEDDYEQLYQYGLDKMNEVIDENNVKYNDENKNNF